MLKRYKQYKDYKKDIVLKYCIESEFRLWELITFSVFDIFVVLIDSIITLFVIVTIPIWFVLFNIKERKRNK